MHVPRLHNMQQPAQQPLPGAASDHVARAINYNILRVLHTHTLSNEGVTLAQCVWLPVKMHNICSFILEYYVHTLCAASFR